MKKIVLSILLLSNLSSFAQTTKNVYFIGNSYTHYNNLPNLIRLIAASTQDILTYQEYTPGGSSLQQHATNPTVTNTINLGTWDYVVLQQQSQMPAFPNANATLNAATQLSNQIRNANPCATPLFYMTWGYKNGDAINCANGVTYMCTYQGMDDKIYDRYMQMTEDNEAVVSPVGRVWKQIRLTYPSYELYDSDHSHPSYLGSMVAAYTFYTVLFKKDPTLTSFNGTLDSTIASNIKQIVKNVVFNNLEEWNVGVNDASINFVSNILPNNRVQFTNTSTNTTRFLWDFGDGTTSTQENPLHTYQNNGLFQVRLTTNPCGKNETLTKEISISHLSNSHVFSEEIQLFPNPTNKEIFITNLSYDTIELFDISGKKVNFSIENQHDLLKINLENFAKGSYLLQLTKENKTQIFNIVKN